MNWNEKLDYALSMIKENRYLGYPLMSIMSHQENIIPHEESLILDKLIDDGFIKSMTEQFGEKYTAVEITGAGIEFLENGGYVARAERQKKEKEFFDINFKKLKRETKFGLWGFGISILAILLTLYQTFFK